MKPMLQRTEREKMTAWAMVIALADCKFFAFALSEVMSHLNLQMEKTSTTAGTTNRAIASSVAALNYSLLLTG